MNLKVVFWVLGGILGSVAISGGWNLTFASHFLWTPSLTVSHRYDDNIFLVPDQKTADFETILQPQLRVSSSTQGASRHILYGAQLVRRERVPQRIPVNQYAEVDWTAPLTKSVAMTLTDKFTYTHAFADISPGEFVATNGSAYLNRSGMGLQFSRAKLSYQYELQGFTEAQYIDTQSHILQEGSSLPFTTHWMITQDYELRYFIQEEEAFLITHTAGTGLRYAPSATFSVGAQGGIAYGHTTIDEPSRFNPTYRFDLEKSFRRLSLNFAYRKAFENELQAGAQYSLRSTTLRLNYSKELTAGGGVFGGAVNRQIAEFQLLHRLKQKAELTVSTSYSTHEPTNSIDSRLVSYGGAIGFSYVLQSWLRASLAYDYFQQNSRSLAQQEFARNQGSFSLTAIMP